MDRILDWTAATGKCVGIFVYPDEEERRVQIVNHDAEGGIFIGWSESDRYICVNAPNLDAAWDGFIKEVES